MLYKYMNYSLITPECEGVWLYIMNIERGIQALPLVVHQNFPLCEDRF